MLQAMSRLKHLRQHPPVFGAMLLEAGKGRLFHQLLFTPEVHAGELDQAVQMLADFFTSAAMDQRQAQFVDRIHEDAVLVVHGANVDRAGVVPS
jgi:hypothetical protein